jgi:lauroyl/myristoyl acyltransferase
MLIALDGNETSSRTRYEFPFCGGTLSLPEGIVRVAKRTGAKLVYAAAVDHGDTVEIKLSPLPDDPLAALGEAVRHLEENLLANPAQWWQWAGVGALWSPAPPADDKAGNCT